MTKTYRRRGNDIDYWEVWQDGRELVLHRGQVGDRGTAYVRPLAPPESPEEPMKHLAEESFCAGFFAVSVTQMAELILRRPVRGFGTDSELASRHALEAALDEVLGWTGNGHVDGGDAGGDELTVSCYVIEPQIALRAIQGEILCREEFSAFQPQMASGGSVPGSAL